MPLFLKDDSGCSVESGLQGDQRETQRPVGRLVQRSRDVAAPARVQGEALKRRMSTGSAWEAEPARLARGWLGERGIRDDTGFWPQQLSGW